MRILLVVPMVPQPDGSGAIPILLHAQLVGLRERHEVTLVSTAGADREEVEAATRLRESGLDVHILDRSPPPSAWRRWRMRARLATQWSRGDWPWRTVWFARPEVQGTLDRLAAGESYDVVAVEDSSMSVFRFPAGVPCVLTEHEAQRVSASAWRSGRLRDRPMELLRTRDWNRWPGFQRSAWKRSDLIQVFTENDAHAIAELAPAVAGRVRVNPFGVVLPAATDPAVEVPGTVLFVGNFSHPPNRDAAVWLATEVMPLLASRHASAMLRIVGNSPPPEVLALAGPHVSVFADAPSVRPHIEAAAVVAAPVRSGGGMRMKVLEALASGKAVVTTSRGTAGFGGFGAPPPLLVADDAPGIAKSIASLLDDAGRRRELGAHAREFAQAHHSPAAWASRLEAVYEEARRQRQEASG